ncbi:MULTISPECIES: uroporphyrinogen-III synthase [unclassified Pseudoalteromonas]|uniref:uroporphyrinogen-III synthase n=1 Tax=unclassified Pseudoalteromonas TaxID=194690 RepID=UPI000C075A94|nr:MULTISPECIES: uroporphyrinogen-III synthase [unclassified Pseudoalteromonas]MDP2633402.1 uroporphyrinogen-III synthase [Pseudoalteromonas sp. 1_MG-2023]PHN90572.1 uroporphyrinogen-III synthase [Pseudoalteromonas sp. 3D05]
MSHILITRPQGKGIDLANQLEQAGYQATLFPVLSIDYLEPNSAQLTPLLNADKIIFISQDAVNALLALKPDINTKAQFYAVGEQTADAIWQAFGVRAAVPKTHDSEGLLALSSLQQVAQQNIVLVKGKKGRPTIANALKERDAFLNSLVVYQRQPVKGAQSDWLDHWQSIDVEGIVITSNAAVDAIFHQLSSAQLQWLEHCQFYVASKRIGEYLKQHLSSANIHIAAGASDSAMFTCISQGKTMSENAKPSASVEVKPAVKAAQKSASTSAEKQEPAMNQNNKRSISKTGGLALLISLIVASGVGYQFYQKLNTSQQENAIIEQLKSNNEILNVELVAVKSAQQTLQQALFNSENKVAAALEKNTAQTQQQLETALQRAEQQAYSLNPQEVTSLQRMAEFKLWAEKDYQGAAAVLSRLDSLLAEHPGTGAIRQAIHQDLQALSSVQRVPVEAIYLKLHGLVEQVENLEFNAVSLPQEVVKEDQHALSENVSDWQQNLANSWHQFKDNFIKIRQREGMAIEPLLTEQERHLIQQRLNLYLTQAQDAVLTKQASVYFTALSQANDLVNAYFKLDQPLTKSTVKALDELSKESLQFKHDIALTSTEQVKEWAK